MTDDAALLLRVSVFGLLAGAIYWFLSYEPLGTVALLLLGVGPGFAGLFIVQHHRSRGHKQDRRELLRRFAGMPEDDPPGPRTLEGQDIAVIPLASIWPFTSSLGLTVALSGLIFGLWLVILGLAIALYSGWGWIAAIMHETRYGHIQPTDELSEPGPASDRERDEAAGRPR